MWMSDKPLVQQRLATDLANLTDELRAEQVLPFLDAFWKTMAREWDGIDRLRMDKFLLLIRRCLNVSFKFISRDSWSHEQEIKACMKVFAATPLNSADKRIPNGLRYHVLDIYIDELQAVDDSEDVPYSMVLEPIKGLSEQSPTETIRKNANDVLLDERLPSFAKESASTTTNGHGTRDDDQWDGFGE